jgi:hypothetical protein
MATMYRGISATTAVEGASPHKLVSMLYQAVAGEIAAARGARAATSLRSAARSAAQHRRAPRRAAFDLAAAAPSRPTCATSTTTSCAA